MLESLIGGERDSEVLADLARGRMRPKIPGLVQAMIGRFGEHHAFLCRMHLDRIDALTRDIATLSTRIDFLMAPFRDVLRRLDTIPGVNQTVAEVIIAETGADSVWLASLAECGLLRASFVPPEPIRQLRDLTRYRSVLTAERTREASRLEKELEDAGIKLSIVASDILGVSGRAMLEALIAGERDGEVLADMARGRMRPK